MKRVIYIIAIIWVGIAVVTSCDKNEGAYYPVPSAFSVTPQTVQSVSKDGGNVEAGGLNPQRRGVRYRRNMDRETGK